MGFFEKIKNGLKKTRAAMANTLGGIFASFSGANEEFYEELEESMILADIGVETSCKAVEQLPTTSTPCAPATIPTGRNGTSCAIKTAFT